ncbi:MAG TPA: ribonuclease T2 [Dokdonella sp.]
MSRARIQRAVIALIVLAAAALLVRHAPSTTDPLPLPTPESPPTPAAPPKHGAREHAAARIAAAGYDYFVMALSWSPTYCMANPREREQCGGRGHGFILHGLWPQYERGGGPQQCRHQRTPDATTVERALAFMPSRRLVHHEWRAHGTCSGLDPAGYFDLSDRAFASIDVPPSLQPPAAAKRVRTADLRAMLRAANPALRDDMLSLHCTDDRLVEVRVCLDLALEPRRCGKRMRDACPQSRPITIPGAG